MLRASCKANRIKIDIRIVADPSARCAIPHYRELVNFTDALLLGTEALLADARVQLRSAVGDAGVTRAAAVVGNFQMMNRALDTIGGTLGEKLPPPLRELAAEIGVEAPPHWG